MALFNIGPDLNYRDTMATWRAAKSMLKIGDNVSFYLHRENRTISGTIKEFPIWCTALIVTEDDHKWGVNVYDVRKNENN